MQPVNQRTSNAKHMKKTLYLDMDNTLVDFRSGIDALKSDNRKRY